MCTEISLNNVRSNVYKVLVIFITDISASGIHGLNSSIFIAFMRSYECLMEVY